MLALLWAGFDGSRMAPKVGKKVTKTQPMEKKSPCMVTTGVICSPALVAFIPTPVKNQKLLSHTLAPISRHK